jgi:hypothetical protein
VFDYFTKHHTKVLLGDFNAKLGGQYIFKQTIRNEILHEDINDNGLIEVNFATSKNLFVNSRMFPHRNSHNKPPTLLVVRLTIRLMRMKDAIQVAKVRERLSASKKAAQKFDGERFNLKNLNEM